MDYAGPGCRCGDGGLSRFRERGENSVIKTKSFGIAGIICLFFLVTPPVVFSFNTTFFIAHEKDVFGEIESHVVRFDKEKMVDIAIAHDIGYNEIAAANPGIDPWYPGVGKKITIPASWILPDIPPSFRQS